MAMNLHKGDNVNRLHGKVIDTIPYILRDVIQETLKFTLMRLDETQDNTCVCDKEDMCYTSRA